MEVRDALIAAAREFNGGRYFEAHEALEEALDDVPDAQWELFLGLIQISVGYHKITQGLFSGAARMLSIGLAKVEPFPGDVADVNLARLRDRARTDLAALEARAFDLESFRRSPPRLQPKPVRDP